MANNKIRLEFQREYSEKRNYMRMNIEAPVTVRVEGLPESIPAMSKNLTAKGILFETKSHIQPNTNVIIEISSTDPKFSSFKASGKILRADNNPQTGQFLIAAEILEILT